MDAIAEKIRKLLALAEGSTNEHEAALAAQRAQEMMLKHHVDEARVHGQDVKADPIAEERAIVFADWNQKGTRIQGWLIGLMGAVSRSVCCDYYYVPGRAIYLVGRESDRQIAKYLFEYLRREIDRLAEQGWNKPGTHNAFPSNAKRWRRGFRLGCVAAIRERLAKPTRPAPAAGQLPAAPVTETALVLRNRLEEVDTWVKDNLKLTSTRFEPPPVHGYLEGHKAGRDLNLDGGRRAVTSGAKRLSAGGGE